MRDLVAAVPNSDRIIRMENGEIKTILNQDGRSAGIVDLRMRTSNFGWAKWQTAACAKQAAGDGSTTISCNATTRLIETRDGGITWNPIEFPGSSSSTLRQSSQTSTTVQAQVSAGPGKTLLLVGQGFDQCEITTLPKLQSWWNSSPYQTVNYILEA